MGHRLKCIIVKHHTCDHNKEHEDEEDVVVESRIATPHGEHKVKFDLPYEQTANAHKVANDPDGYDGMIFCRWAADAIGKAIKLDWEKFV